MALLFTMFLLFLDIHMNLSHHKMNVIHTTQIDSSE